jgi:sterol desaturase/sphingolipid hydroxylase (fatty acid hydroxylase superfamily)
LFGLLHYHPMPLSQMLAHNLVHLRDLSIAEYGIFLVSCGFYAVLLMRLQAAGSYRFRVRSQVAKRAQMGRELFNSTRAFVIYNALQIVMRIAALGFGYILTFNVKLPLWEEALSFPLIIILHDAYFYWAHWLMHWPPLFKLMHWEHHRSRNPTVLTAHSFAVGESLVQGAFPILYAVFFPCSFTTLIFFYVVMIVHDVAIHSGVELFPPLLVTDKFLGWWCGTTHHDIHHAVGRTNYGLYFRFWDRLMKTEHPQFERVYAYVRASENDGQAYELLSRGAAGVGATPQSEPASVALEPASS